MAVRRVCDDGARLTLKAAAAYDTCRAAAIAGVAPQVRVLVARSASRDTQVAYLGRVPR